MRKRLLQAVACLLLILTPTQAEAAPLWFRFNGYHIIDRRYTGRKLKTPMPAGKLYGVRYREPSIWSDDWYEGTHAECLWWFKGKQFTYNMTLKSWLCLDTVKPA